MKKTLSILVFTLLFSNIFADKGVKISFSKKLHDFSKVEEKKGIVSTIFEFTNDGNKPLIVRNVTTSCGCTTPEWTKKPIMPGKKGFVKATFNPLNRPGRFNKSITVFTNSEKPKTVLTITGSVIRKKESIKELYPYQLGQLRYNINRFAITRIFKGNKKSAEIKVYNPTDKDITLGFENTPDHVDIKMSRKKIKSKKSEIITCIYDSKNVKDWGYTTNYMYVLEKETGKKSLITVTANIVEDFTKFTKKDLENAAKIEVKETMHNFGDVNEGTVAKHIFKLKNIGKSTLNIRKIKASCGCTAVNHSSNTVEPGESTDIEVAFKTRGRKGKQHKQVHVVTNDPKQSSITLRFKANILTKGEANN